MQTLSELALGLGADEIVLLMGKKGFRFKQVDSFDALDEGSFWSFPIGTDKYPVHSWYIATVHDLSGVKNHGYRHSGIDYNLDKSPWGDIDRGLPVWAVADGVVYATWYSERNLGAVVIKVVHEGKPLWVRYWHLAKDDTFKSLWAGIEVRSGQCIGHIGAYRAGDHLHFDMALNEFHPGAWLSPGVLWVDPVPILKAHLDPKLVDASLRRGD